MAREQDFHTFLDFLLRPHCLRVDAHALIVEEEQSSRSTSPDQDPSPENQEGRGMKVGDQAHRPSLIARGRR